MKRDGVITEFKAYWQIADELLEKAVVARILALQSAHYARTHGELPLPKLFELLKLTEIGEKELEVLRDGTEALVGPDRERVEHQPHCCEDFRRWNGLQAGGGRVGGQLAVERPRWRRSHSSPSPVSPGWKAILASRGDVHRVVSLCWRSIAAPCDNPSAFDVARMA